MIRKARPADGAWKQGERMRIASVEAYVLRAPLYGGAYWGARSWGDERPVRRTSTAPAFERWRPAYERTVTTLAVRVRDQDGASGWGEAKAPAAAEVTRATVELLL